MMEPARTCPAIGASINRFVTKCIADTVKFLRNHIQCCLPVNRNKGVLSAQCAIAFHSFFEKPPTDHWLGNAARASSGVNNGSADERRLRIFLKSV